MPKPYSQDLRNRVIDAVEGGEMSRRAAARRYAISESVAIKWLERVERHGSREPVGHGGHRASKLMPHLDFLGAARSEKSDITLQALCDRLWSERGVEADTSMMSRFFRRIGITLKKRPSSRASRIARTPAPTANDGEPIRASSILGAWSSSTRPGQRPRRDLDKDQHDPPARLGAEGRAPRRQGSSWPLEDRDLPRRAAQRPHRSAMPVRRADQRRTLPRLRRTVPRSDPQARRRRDPRQSRLHKGKAVRRAIRDVGARLVFLPKYSPDLNPIEQVFAKFKTLLRKVGARSYEAVSQACAQILTQYPPEECAAYIRNAGYA